MKSIHKFIFVILFCAILSLEGCRGQKSDNVAERIVTAKIETPITPLFFSGTVQPIKTVPVISPVDGRVVNLLFQYGELVQKGQLLVVISSPELADQYRKDVTSYLSEKDKYYSAIDNLKASEMLYKAQVYSKDQLSQDRSAYENEALAFFQAGYQLEKTLKQVGIDPQQIERLTLRNLSTVNMLLRQHFSSIPVKASGDGVALFPIPGETAAASSDNDKTNGKLTVGSQLKMGQLLLTIGDLSGLTAQIQVSEIDINRIKPGMKVQITGDAFPDITLDGIVTDVSSQANPDQQAGGGALSMFNATVKVPMVTPEQQRVIHVGMTAKIEIDIKEPSHIMLPIQAVEFGEDGEPYVTVEDANGNRKKVHVQTGNTTATKIAITHGLKEGDKVVVHD